MGGPGTEARQPLQVVLTVENTILMVQFMLIQLEF